MHSTACTAQHSARLHGRVILPRLLVRHQLPEAHPIGIDVTLFVVGLRPQHLCVAGRAGGGAGRGRRGIDGWVGGWVGAISGLATREGKGRRACNDGNIGERGHAHACHRAGRQAGRMLTWRRPLWRASLALGAHHRGGTSPRQPKVAHLQQPQGQGKARQGRAGQGRGTGGQVRQPGMRRGVGPACCVSRAAARPRLSNANSTPHTNKP